MQTFISKRYILKISAILSRGQHGIAPWQLEICNVNLFNFLRPNGTSKWCWLICQLDKHKHIALNFHAESWILLSVKCIWKFRLQTVEHSVDLIVLKWAEGPVNDIPDKYVWPIMPTKWTTGIMLFHPRGMLHVNGKQRKGIWFPFGLKRKYVFCMQEV